MEFDIFVLHEIRDKKRLVKELIDFIIKYDLSINQFEEIAKLTKEQLVNIPFVTRELVV